MSIWGTEFDNNELRRKEIASLVDKYPVCGLDAAELEEFIVFLQEVDHTLWEEDWSKERWEALGFTDKKPPKNIDRLGKKLKVCVDEEPMGWNGFKKAVELEKTNFAKSAHSEISNALLQELTPLKTGKSRFMVGRI